MSTQKIARLREGTGEYDAIDDLMEWAADEIEHLQKQVAQVTRERDNLVRARASDRGVYVDE